MGKNVLNTILIPLSLKPTNKKWKKNNAGFMFTQRQLDQELHDSIEARKNPSGREGNKRDFEGSVAKLCDCRWHTHSSGGRDEKCSNWT
jgi:hypothetical protein